MRHSVLLLLFLAASIPAFADTIHVSKDYPLIQQAIDAASDGDTVLVDPGTYAENIDFKGKGITVRSANGAGVTVLDGSQAGSVVTFDNGEYLDSMLDGFTVMNGSGTYVYTNNDFEYVGGGILCQSASPTLCNNIITKNWAEKGGGIWCWCDAVYGYSSPLITGNTVLLNTGGGIHCDDYAAAVIASNLITVNNSARGGGIRCDGSSPEIRDNLIDLNGADKYGGGIFCNLGAAPIIVLNTLRGNKAGEGGGGIAWRKSFGSILDNAIIENEAKYGGGIYSFLDSNPAISGNVIAGNHADNQGGGIHCASSATVTNNTVASNSANKGGGISVEMQSNVTISNSICWNNIAATFPEIKGDPTVTYCDVKGGWPGTGNIAGDPLFADVLENDFHLRYTSPCRNAGDDSAPNLPDADFEGDPRIASGIVDMGADEFHTHLYYTGDMTPGGYAKIKITETPGTASVILWAGSGVLDPPEGTKYGNWYLQYPLLFEAGLAPPPPEGILVLPLYFPPGLPVPLEVPLQALCGLKLTNLSVLRIE